MNLLTISKLAFAIAFHLMKFRVILIKTLIFLTIIFNQYQRKQNKQRYKKNKNWQNKRKNNRNKRRSNKMNKKNSKWILNNKYYINYNFI